MCLSERLNGSACDLSLSAVTVAKLKDAELNLVRYVQKLCFSDAYRSMSCGSRRPILKSSPLYRLSPIMVDGILRVDGRLDRAYFHFDVKHPIILPTDHHLTELIIEDVHSRIVGHVGVEATLNQICKRFWFSHANTIIYRVLRKCVICKRRDARPCKQIMAELPLAWLKIHEAPFSETGVDYFGPLLVKQGRGTRKRYGCLFACLTTRAIHLEVAIDLTTSAFINCFRKFIARRGPVKHIFSDNATNFVGCNRELREAVAEWNKLQIHTALRQKEIEWTFNPLGASHMGGSLERMIRTERNILMVLIPKYTVTDDLLHTILLEVEEMVNFRPLCLSLEPGSNVPLTPNHLLRIDPSIGLPLIKTGSDDCYAYQRYRLVQLVADQFWMRWVQKYAKTIILRKKWHEQKRNLLEGDVVLVLDSNSPRGHWLLGQVLETFPNKFGMVRNVRVKTACGETRKPISKLCVILQVDAEGK